MATTRKVTLPDLGEGLTESDVVEWTVAVGDRIELNQVVAEVETAKALVQLPSPYAGVVVELLVEPGTTVPVGTALLTIAVDEPAGAEDDAGSGPAPEADARASAGTAEATEPAVTAEAAKPAVTAEAAMIEAAEPAARTSVLVGYGPLVEASARPRRRARSARWMSAHPVGAGAGGQADGVSHRTGAGGRPTGRPKAHPPVRKVAHDLGVSLDLVQGTGADGLITREDVLRTASGTSASGTPGTGGSGTVTSDPSREVRIPVSGVRRQTAAAMVASAFTAPHASVFLTVDVTPTTELVAELRADRAMAGHRVTLLTLVAKALTIAVGRNPSVNARWDEDAQEIVQYRHLGLGIAAATPRGLLVPTIKDADRMRLPELADAISALTEAARAGTTTPADLGGGTITITNVGVFGVDTGTPILVPGQAAIVAIGAVRRRPWEHQDRVELRDVMTLSLSFDHRLVDGEQAARFLADLGAVLARPGAVLTMV